MNTDSTMRTSDSLRHVRYEIRGRLARRAYEMQRQGYEIISLNIGNPGAFGFRTPETMRLAMIENLGDSEAYCHQKGIFPAREAVVMQQQARGVHGVTVDDVFMGNGVSELIDLVLRALLNRGDEVLVPSPDYPLWTAAVTLNGGKVGALSLPRRRTASCPIPHEVAQARHAANARDRRHQSQQSHRRGVSARRARRSRAALPSATGSSCSATRSTTRCSTTALSSCRWRRWCTARLCATMSGLSKVYRACGYRVGWASFSGRTPAARDYFAALELLSSLRLCSNVPAQWAVQTALGGHQSIRELVSPGRAPV